MSLKRKSLNVVIFILAVGVFLPQSVLAEREPAYSSANPELLKARDQIYNLEFSSAEKIIEEHIKKDSRDPYGYLMRGILNDWKQLVYGKYGSQDKKVFEDFDQARILAQVSYDADRHNIQKKITLAHTLMYVSKKMIDMGENFRAGGYLKRARDIMLYVQLHYPNHPEVDLPLGVFYYYSANVPDSLKWLASLLGFRGDIPKGLMHMQRAAEAKNFSQMDAKHLLAFTLYDGEKKFEDAEKYLKDLMRQFPNNPEFRFHYAKAMLVKKDYAKASERFQALAGFCEKRCHKKYQFLAQYYLAEAHLKAKQYDTALVFAEKALDSAPRKEKKRKALLHSRLAFLYQKKKDEKQTCAHAKDVKKYESQANSVWKAVQKKYDACFEG